MRFIAWNLALAGWLLLSAFTLGHTVESAAVTGLLAVLLGTFSIASPGLPGLRFANSALALTLAWVALLMPDVSGIARANSAVVAAVAFVLSVIPARSDAAAVAPTQLKR